MTLIAAPLAGLCVTTSWASFPIPNGAISQLLHRLDKLLATLNDVHTLWYLLRHLVVATGSYQNPLLSATPTLPTQFGTETRSVIQDQLRANVL